MRKYIIIGSGVAGIAAIQAIRQQDSSGQVTLVSDDPHGYYSRPGMAYYLTGEINDEFLFPFSEIRFRQLNARQVGDHVTRIFPYLHTLDCRSGRHLEYDRLLIATGSTATPLKIPGAELEGVVKLDNLEDARHILKLAKRGRTAAVTGGGITALELVEALCKRGVQVHLFLRGDYFWHNVLEQGEARFVEERLEKEGVQIHRKASLTEISGRGGKVEAVQTADGQQLKADIVAVAVGVRPTMELAEASGIQTERGILVDEFLQTNQADVFAAGDVAQVYDAGLKKGVVESLWRPASLQGTCAGMNMSGAHQPYVRPPAVNITRLAGVTTAIIGAVGQNQGAGDDEGRLSITHGDSESWRDSLEAIVARLDYDVNHLRIMVGEKTLTGAVVMGEQSLTPILRDLVTRQTDISSIRSALLAPDAPVSSLIQNFAFQLEIGNGPQGT